MPDLMHYNDMDPVHQQRWQRPVGLQAYWIDRVDPLDADQKSGLHDVAKQMEFAAPVLIEAHQTLRAASALPVQSGKDVGRSGSFVHPLVAMYGSKDNAWFP